RGAGLGKKKTRAGDPSSVFRKFTADLLKPENQQGLAAWFTWQHGPDAEREGLRPVFEKSEWDLCRRIAAQSLAHGNDPVAMFIHKATKGKRDLESTNV